MRIGSWQQWRCAIALAGALAASILSAALAAEKIPLCHVGVVQLLSFARHLDRLRTMPRYSREDIDGLAALQRKGGPQFFSSQIFVQEAVSSSGAFELRTIHGLLDARHYRNVTPWTCRDEDYPIATFVGFRVRRIAGGTIVVSRAPGIVNVLSLKALDPDLNKKIKVRLSPGDKPICDDIGAGCAPTVFYDRG